MKRWSGYFVLCFILFGAFAFIAADNLSFSENSNRLPKGSVLFSVLEQETETVLYSGKTLAGGNFIYTLEIKSKMSEVFINPKIEGSANINILSPSDLQALNSVNCANENLNSEIQSKKNNNKGTSPNEEINNETSLNNKHSANGNIRHINHISNEYDSYTNTKNNSENSNAKILIRFYIKSGTQINFNFSADNYAKDSVKYNIIPYSAFFNVTFLNLTDESGKEYNLENIDAQSEIFKLYNVDELFFEQATKDRFPCLLDFILIFDANVPNETALPTECVFNICSTKPDILEIADFDETTGQGKIKPKSIGTATTIISIEKQSDSGCEVLVSKSLKFEVVNIPVENIENVPENYSINLAYSNSIELNLTFSPAYAKLQFLLNDNYENKIAFQNDSIISLSDKNSIGNDDMLEIIFYMILKNTIISANVTIINRTFNPLDNEGEYFFTITLDDTYTQTTIGLDLNEDASNSFILNIDLSKFSTDTEIEICLKVRLVNKENTEIDCNFSDIVTDNNEIFKFTPELTADSKNIFIIISSAGTAILTISSTELSVSSEIKIYAN